MTRSAPTSGRESPARDVALAFAPLHKRAFGTAVGIVLGIAVFATTAWCILRGDPPGLIHSVSYVLPLHDVTWAGAVLGSGSAAFAFFVAGFAFHRVGDVTATEASRKAA